VHQASLHDASPADEILVVLVPVLAAAQAPATGRAE